jgi:hypothetical protein
MVGSVVARVGAEVSLGLDAARLSALYISPTRAVRLMIDSNGGRMVVYDNLNSLACGMKQEARLFQMPENLKVDGDLDPAHKMNSGASS